MNFKTVILAIDTVSNIVFRSRLVNKLESLHIEYICNNNKTL